jgi:predicted RNase H-like HicB family nuclease
MRISQGDDCLAGLPMHTVARHCFGTAHACLQVARKTSARLPVFGSHCRPEGGYSVSVPSLPGCHSQGESLDEALANIREAADLWMEVAAERATHEIQNETPDAQIQEIEL